MNKMQEEFEKKYTAEFLKTCGYKIEFDEYWDNPMIQEEYTTFSRGYESANLLPTEKVCPKCGNRISFYGGCDHCNNTRVIQIYYTPEQYEEIMGKPYPDDALVWNIFNESGEKWNVSIYKRLKDWVSPSLLTLLIVQTAQPAPPTDYKLKK